MNPKIPLLALLYSFIWPGAGHYYAGRRKRGIFFAILTVLALLPPMMFLFASNARGYFSLLIPAPLMLVLYAMLAVEAYGHAKFHNDQEGLIDPISTQWPFVVGLAAFYLIAVVVSTDRLARFTAENVALPFMVGSHSMEPTFTTGELYMLDKRVYEKSSPQRGDVILFSLPGVYGEDFIKRVVGLPGETIEITSGSIKINGHTVTIPGAEGIDYLNMGPLAVPGTKLKIPPDRYYLLGDNSGHSVDSRYWGPVSREYIKGKVLPIAGPWNKRGASLKKGIDDFWSFQWIVR